MSKRQKNEVKTVNFYEFIAEGMIRKIAEAPIMVEIRLADGSITVEITKKHPWFKELNRQRVERAEALRTSFRKTMGL